MPTKYIKLEFSFIERIHAFLGFIDVKYFMQPIEGVNQEFFVQTIPIAQTEKVSKNNTLIKEGSISPEVKIPFFDLDRDDKKIKSNL